MIGCFSSASLNLGFKNDILSLQGWPIGKPDILVSTPAALLNNIDPNRNRREEFVHAVKYVVCNGFFGLLHFSINYEALMDLFAITVRCLMKLICFCVGASRTKLSVLLICSALMKSNSLE